MPRWGQMSRSANTLWSRARAMSMGSPSNVLCTICPGRRSAPTSATYHIPRTSSALSSCIALSPGCPPPSSHRHDEQVGIAGLAPRLRQHAMHLAAMMGLVIEHVGEQKPFRPADLGLDRSREPGEIAGHHIVVELFRPTE